MELYTLLRAFADSWFLLVMFLIFIGVIVYAYRPNSRKADRNAANIVFRHDDKPAGDADGNVKSLAGRKEKQR